MLLFFRLQDVIDQLEFSLQADRKRLKETADKNAGLSSTLDNVVRSGGVCLTFWYFLSFLEVQVDRFWEKIIIIIQHNNDYNAADSNMNATSVFETLSITQNFRSLFNLHNCEYNAIS